MSRSIPQDKKANLHQLAKRGDMVAQALVQMLQEVQMTPGALNAGSIHVVAQVVDGVGVPITGVQNVLLKATTAGGAAAITPTTGTVKSGSGTDSVWAQTDTEGALEFDVDDGSAGDLCILEVKTTDGITGVAALQF